MQNIPKIVIIGKHGQVAWELQRTVSTLGNVIALDRHEASLQDPQLLCQTLRDIRPSVIINAAAYTAVDLAETEQEAAMAINGVAPGILAEEARRLNAHFIHYSTDYVFDGSSSTPYLENDATNPINFYGKSKRAGELAIEAVGGNYLILRTSWVYGARGKNFFLTMLKLAQERSLLKIVNDQIGAPTWSRHIAEATSQIIAKSLSKDFSWDENRGLYHLAAAGATSWCDFAKEIFSLHSSHMKSPEVIGIPSHEYPLPAKRPAFSLLDCEKLYKNFSVYVPNWIEGLRLCGS